MVFGAMVGNNLHRNRERLKVEVKELYSKLYNLNPKDDLLNLIEITSKRPFEFDITQKMEEKYPCTEKEKESFSFILFEDINLLEKYVSDLRSKLSVQVNL